MTESPIPYTAGVAVIAVDPQIAHICMLLFHRAITAYEAAKQLTELQHRRLLEFQAGWIAVDSGNGWIAFAQEDELFEKGEIK